MLRFLLRAMCVTACVLMGCRSSGPEQPTVTEQPAVTEQATVTEPSAEEPQAASEQLAAWLAAFNTADLEKIAAFRRSSLARELPGSPSLETVRDFAEQIGGFVLVRTEESTSTKCVAILRELESEQYVRASVEVEPAAPHKIIALELQPIPTPEDLLPPRMSEEAALSALRSKVDALVAADRFSGAVLVAKDGVPILAEAYGFADRERKLANTVDTRFRLGSMNKMFTAVALVQLAQAGKIELDAPIGTYLRKYPNADVASKVTPHHLLSHTGGTGDIFGPEFDAKRLELRTHADYVKLYGARGLEHEPGSQWRYSNYGFVLAGAVIEAVTRKSYYDHVAKAVYAPAGMTSTASPPEGDGLSGRVVAYSRASRKEPWASAADTLPWRGTAAGGGDSTVKDLLAFANALTNHRLLDAEHLELVTTSKAPPETGIQYGYGFSIDAIAGVRCFGHGGGAPGMNGQLYICESGYTIAVLANFDPPVAGQIAAFVAARLPAQ
jgi:D-alanyl-D-alanine carboxypeptidase